MSVSLFWQAFSISYGTSPLLRLGKKERCGGEISGESDKARWFGTCEHVWQFSYPYWPPLLIVKPGAGFDAKQDKWEARMKKKAAFFFKCLFQISFKKTQKKTQNELKRGSETHHVPSVIFIPLFFLCFPFLYTYTPYPLFKNHAFKWKKGPLGQAKGHRSRFFPRLDNWLPSPGNSSLAYAA